MSSLHMRLSTGSDSLNCTIRGSVSPVKRPPHSFFSGAGCLVLGISADACSWNAPELPLLSLLHNNMDGCAKRTAWRLCCALPHLCKGVHVSLCQDFKGDFKGVNSSVVPLVAVGTSVETAQICGSAVAAPCA